MSTEAFFADFDPAAHAAFAEAGMGAGAGIYTPAATEADPDPEPITDVRVYINRGQAVPGEFHQRAFATVSIGYLLADVTPIEGGTLLLDGVTWRNTEEIDNDGSISTWAVRRV